MLFYPEYYEFDESVKDEAWADKLIMHFRYHWKELITFSEAEEGMKIILSADDIGYVLDMFKDPKKIAKEFIPLCIMEKIRISLVGDAVKAGVNVDVDANDPSSLGQKDNDKTLLENRQSIEELITFLNGSMGMPPYKLSDDKDVYKGNVQMFDKLGLDQGKGYQVEYFFEVWHRLLHEMDAQAAINFVFDENELENYVEYWINDILAKKAISLQLYVNQQSGKIDVKYLGAEQIRLIPGKRDDGKDAVCIGYLDSITISEVISRLGNKFDMNEDYGLLLQMVNYYYPQKNLTGIWDDSSGNKLLLGQSKNACQMSDFLQFGVQLGYIEWKSWNAFGEKHGTDYHGNFRMWPWSGWKKNDGPAESDESHYEKDIWALETTYKSYFLATSSSSQILIGYGKLYHQAIEGSEDEYSNYSIRYKKKPGPTVARIAKPWIMLAQECFAKFRWMVRAAKPKGRSYNFEALVRMGKQIIKSGDDKKNVQGLIDMFQQGINEMFMVPEKNGQIIGGGANPNADLPNGLDPTAITFQNIIDWAVNNALQDINLSKISTGNDPLPRQPVRLQMQSQEASKTATSYVPVMLDHLLTDAAKHVLLLVQDIVRYKETMPYRYLTQTQGEEAVTRFYNLDSIAFHRYGIFVRSYSSFSTRQQIRQDTQDAFHNKEITYDVKIMIDSVKDWRKAAYILAFEKMKAIKIEQDAEAQKQHNEMALKQAEWDGKINLQKEVNKGKIAEADTTGGWNFKIAELTSGNKQQLQTDKGVQRADELTQKTDEEIKKETAKHNLHNQAALPVSSSPVQAGNQ